MSKLDQSSLPQGRYFPKAWKIPGTSWTITGHSRALERTGFWIPELRVMLDAGVALPTDKGNRPSAILVTHGHIDHMNALPMLFRFGNRGDPPTHVVAPAAITHRLRQFSQLSWAVKVDETEELPINYRLPSDTERESLVSYCTQVGGTDQPLVLSYPEQVWHAVQKDQSFELAVGKNAATPLLIHTLQQFHGLCTSIGYLLSTPARTQKKFLPHLQGTHPKETGQNIRAAQSRGEETHYEVTIPAERRLAFVLDTTVEALDIEKSSTAERILACPVIMIECTYLEASKESEAAQRGHVWWGGLVPHVHAHHCSKTWVLVH